ALILLVLISAGIFVAKPQWVLNTKNLKRVIWLVAPDDFHVQWQSLRFTSTTPRFLVHEYSLSGKDVCINEIRMEGCFENLSARIRVNYRRWPYIIEGAGPVGIKSKQLRIVLAE